MSVLKSQYDAHQKVCVSIKSEVKVSSISSASHLRQKPLGSSFFHIIAGALNSFAPSESQS